jgi:very-short-patch-repair endonuclease
MRRNPTEPEKRVWRILSNSQLCGFKFRRQAALPPFIADFLCPSAKLIVEVDGDTDDELKDALRNGDMSMSGYRVLRVSNLDVMTNLSGVFDVIAAALFDASRPVRRPHPNPSPEGEGLAG